MTESTRFLAVALVGLMLDLAIAWGGVNYLSLPLWLAAVFGFTIAAMANYVMHELWTFQKGARTISAERSVLYVSGMVGSLASRIAAVVILTDIVPEVPTLLILATAAGTSFATSFLINKYFVFRAITK